MYKLLGTGSLLRRW